jgi:hypothetical protein
LAREALSLSRRRTASFRCHVIRAPASVILGSTRTYALGDPAALKEPIDCAVQRAWQQRQPPFRAGFDVLEDRVAVEVAAGKRQQDFEFNGGKRLRGLV